jgi:predicted metalloprotease
MRPPLLVLAVAATTISLIPTASSAKEILKKEKYGRDEKGVVLTCRTPKDKGILGRFKKCGDCEYYALWTKPMRLTTYTSSPAVRGLW